MTRTWDAWLNVGEMPAEVKAYEKELIDNEHTAILDIDSLCYGTPDGNVTNERWTVVSVYKNASVTVKRFYFELNAENIPILSSTNENMYAPCEVLQWAKALLKMDDFNQYYFDKLDRPKPAPEDVEGVA